MLNKVYNYLDPFLNDHIGQTTIQIKNPYIFFNFNLLSMKLDLSNEYYFFLKE